MSDPNEQYSVIKDILNELAVITGVYGGLGGVAHAVLRKTTWRDGARIVFVGSITAFAVGSGAPYVLKWLLPELAATGAGPQGDALGFGLGLITSSAFIIGAVAVVAIERLLRRIEGSTGGKDDAAKS